MFKKQKGFTLVELLVVIAIIAILAGVLLIAINPQAIMQKGRDARRMQELAGIRDALNIALTEGEITLTATGTCTDCTSDVGGVAAQAVDGTGWVKYALPTGKTGLSKYVPSLPVDPTNSGSNVYTFASSTSAFELNTVLESPDYVVKMTTDGGNNANAYEMGTTLTLIP